MVARNVGPARSITANSINVAIAVGPIPNQMTDNIEWLLICAVIGGAFINQTGNITMLAPMSTPAAPIIGLNLGNRLTKIVLTA